MKGRIYMKKKISKIILILSFTPYVFCLLYGIYLAVYELDWFFNVRMMVVWLCYFPVIPVCLIYQIIYLIGFIIRVIIKKHILKNLISKLLGIFYL